MQRRESGAVMVASIPGSGPAPAAADGGIPEARRKWDLVGTLTKDQAGSPVIADLGRYHEVPIQVPLMDAIQAN